MSTSTVNISAGQVKELREKTGAPMGDCKNALVEAKGDLEQAIVWLRKKGVATAAKKSSRATSEGAVASYIHAGGKIGVLLEVNCESDFVARTDDFKELVHDIAMHIAATDPRYVRREDVTAADFEREKDIYRAQAAATGKPAQVIEKIVEGKMEKFYEEVCLIDQPSVTDPKTTVGPKWAQSLVVVIIAALETVFRLMQFVYAPFYALFIVGPIANLIEIALTRRGASSTLRDRPLPS